MTVNSVSFSNCCDICLYILRVKRNFCSCELHPFFIIIYIQIYPATNTSDFQFMVIYFKVLPITIHIKQSYWKIATNLDSGILISSAYWFNQTMVSNPITITLWHDYTWPWCFISLGRLNELSKSFSIKLDI